MEESAVARRVAAPSWPLFGSVAATTVSLLLAWTNAFAQSSVSVVQLVVGYVLGSIVAVGFLSFYRSRRNVLRANPRFRPQPLLDRVMLIVLIIGMSSGIVNAILFALEVAKQ